jgi:hypothetical protein
MIREIHSTGSTDRDGSLQAIHLQKPKSIYLDAGMPHEPVQVNQIATLVRMGQIPVRSGHCLLRLAFAYLCGELSSLWFAKILADFEINNLAPSSRHLLL